MAARRKPRIGVVIGSKPIWRVRAAADYRRAIIEAGGVPLLIGQGDEAKVSGCQGLLLTGGPDIHPSLYPRRPQDASFTDSGAIERFQMSVEDARDSYDLPLTKRAVEENIPVLGICRGFQLLNVASGGGLVPDVPSCLPNPLKHSYKKGEGDPRHTVTISDGSLLAGIAGVGETTVNTYHHQGVTRDELAPALSASAIAPDGLVEAIEMPSHAFLLGIQWHPERRKDTEVKERFRSLFEALISAARAV